MPDSLPSTPRVSTFPSVVTFRPDPVADYAQEGKEGGLSLRELLAVLRRHVWMIAAVTIVSVGLTVHLLSREVRLYDASALIRLTDQRAIAGTAGEVAPHTVVLKTDPIKSQLMVLQGRGVLGEVVDREQLRLLDAVELAWPDYLASVQVTTPPSSSQSIALQFGPDRNSARTRNAAAEAQYGAPVDVGGVHFVVPKPPTVPSASLIVLPRE
ncbi:MAG: Wzz/FepE/Etk N-terminal domain-containing protein, partial [bacterium]